MYNPHTINRRLPVVPLPLLESFVFQHCNHCVGYSHIYLPIRIAKYHPW